MIQIFSKKSMDLKKSQKHNAPADSNIIVSIFFIFLVKIDDAKLAGTL